MDVTHLSRSNVSFTDSALMSRT